MFDYIKLNSINDEALIGNIKKIDMLDNTIFVFDNKSKAVFLFDIEGNFINKICDIGYGPKEYSEIRDFVLDKQNKTIMILDFQKILVYDFDGNYQATLKIENLNLNPKQFIKTDKNNYYLWSGTSYTEDKNCLFLWNEKNFSGVLKSDNYIIETQRFISKWDNNYLLVPPVGDFNIYEICETKFYKKYFIDFGKLAITQTITKEDIEQIDSKSNFTRITNVQETKKWLYVLVKGSYGKYYEILIDKETQKCFFGKFNSNNSFQIIYADENYFFALVEPAYILESKQESILYSLKNIDITEYDNPVLVRFSL